MSPILYGYSINSLFSKEGFALSETFLSDAFSCEVNIILRGKKETILSPSFLSSTPHLGTFPVSILSK